MLNSSLEDRFVDDVSGPRVATLSEIIGSSATPIMKVKFLRSGAQLPTVAHPGKDLGYDVYCAQGVLLYPGAPTKVYTGIAIELAGYGFRVEDRGSMASRGVTTSAGVIDDGYTGEITVIMTLSSAMAPVYLGVGDKIAQLIPERPQTLFPIYLAASLTESERGANGFGSTGK